MALINFPPLQMNLVKYRAFMRKAEVAQFFKPYSRGLWNSFEHISSVATVNAYYNQVCIRYTYLKGCTSN